MRTPRVRLHRVFAVNEKEADAGSRTKVFLSGGAGIQGVKPTLAAVGPMV